MKFLTRIRVRACESLRLWRNDTDTDTDTLRAAQERVAVQQHLAAGLVARHRFHRERNHFADRLAAAYAEERR